MKTLASIWLALLVNVHAFAHDGHPHEPSAKTRQSIVHLNTQSAKRVFVWQRETADRPHAAACFDPFADKLNVRLDREFLYVESDGMPVHPMMIGITAWQQQVPIPQPYIGNNAWQIPRRPVPAKNPVSARTNFFRGAIALAANGVPIFNPIKNDGKTDTLLAGELDQWGGHCGRADDYHYHIPPVHLEQVVGVGNPIAVALDGYLIYGFNDPNGQPPTDLDWLNGHQDPDGNYHYHATRTYPYLNGGFYGEVVQRDGQVHPQPRARAVRPSLPGLRGTKITGYENPGAGKHVVRYEVNGDKRSVEYSVAENGSATFNFVSQRGTYTENYASRQSGGRGGPGGRDDGATSRGPDPIARALDTNRDGQVDRVELQNAARSLSALDKNMDGRVSVGELRGGEPGRGTTTRRRSPQSDSPGRVGGPHSPQASEGARQPWILVHAEEIDLDRNKIISRDEIIGEASKAFAGYDTNNDGKLTASEMGERGRSRSAMGGFLRGHTQEIDRNGDGVVARDEAIGNAERMFAKMDRNADGLIDRAEMEAGRRSSR